MPAALSTLLAQVLDGHRRPTLVLLVDSAAEALAGDDLPDGVVRGVLGEPLPRDGGWAAVVLVVPDVAVLRRAVSVLPPLGRARTVVCVVAEAGEPVPLVPLPTWPPLQQYVARVAEGGAVTRVELQRGVPVAEVLLELGRHAGGPVVAGPAGVLLAQSDGDGDGRDRTTVPPVDRTLVLAADAATAVPEPAKVPPEVWLGPAPAAPLPDHPVTGRPPTVVDGGEDVALGPLDEALLNPRGFAPAWSRGPVRLADVLPPTGEATPTLVAALRDAQAVTVPAEGHERLVAGLAMAGVPLVAERLTPRSRALLGAAVADGLTRAVDLDDPVGREEHSVRLRRAALRHHSALGWRARLAARAGVRHAAYPSVSVVVHVADADQAARAVAQVRRQRGADVELLLAVSGTAPDPASLRAAAGDLAVTVLDAAGDGPLAAATRAAAGDVVVRLDPDGWYAPDLVADLLLARHYAGAGVVEAPAELRYARGADTTTRLHLPTERYVATVAGPAVAVDRALLRAVRDAGGRDADLLAAVRRGGVAAYRTHGLAAVLPQDGGPGGPGGTGGGPGGGAGGRGVRGRLGGLLGRRQPVDSRPGFRPSALLDHPEGAGPDARPGSHPGGVPGAAADLA